MTKKLPNILILHDICGVGKAATTNMLPILNVMGVETNVLPTVLLSTHTGGYKTPAKQYVSPEYIRACAEHYAELGLQFDAIFIGYLGTVDMVQAVKYFLEKVSARTVFLDPIMGDHLQYYQGLDDAYAESLVSLLPKVDVLLPNYTEACFLSKKTQWKEIVKELQGYHLKQLVITSVKNEDRTDIFVAENGNEDFLTLPMLAYSGHGTGDLFDGVLVGALLTGEPLKKGVLRAHTFVKACIEDSIHAQYEERAGLLFEQNLKMLV